MRQLGYTTLDGQQIAHFMFDYTSAQQTNLGGTAQLGKSKLTVSFPADTVRDLGPSWEWYSVLNIDGLDVSECQP